MMENISKSQQTMDEMKEELDEIMDANEFMRRQIDLFAAFIWRHQQKEKQTELNLSPSNVNNDNNKENENENEASKEDANTIDIDQDTKISIADYDKLQHKLRVDLRLEMGNSEKYLIKNEIEELITKSEKDIDTLRAVLEECKLRMIETKKDAYDFKRDIVISSQQNKNGNNNLGEKIKRFITDKLKTKNSVLKKYKTKNVSLQQQISKLQEQLKMSYNSQSGDSFHVIDLEQLKIQNAQYNQIILERNKELLKLKMNTGKTVQQLNNYKQELMEQTKKTKVLECNITDREGLIIRLDEELIGVERELNKQNKMLSVNKQKIQNADIPSIIDYVNTKKNQHKLEKKLKSYERKIEIAELSAKQAKKMVKMHNQHTLAQTQ